MRIFGAVLACLAFAACSRAPADVHADLCSDMGNLRATVVELTRTPEDGRIGAVRGDLDCRYGPDGVRFTWEGNDEMDPAFGAGSARCAPDGSLTGEICFHRGDESTFKARKW